MNISSTNFNKTANFKGGYSDDGIIGYDDAISEQKRQYIREHYDEWRMPFQSIYDKGSRLSDYQVKQITDRWEKYHNIQKIPGTNIYRGQTLVDKTKELYKLKQKGIKTIIDLVGYGNEYKEAILNAGFDYYTYNIYENWWNINDFEPKHVDKLVDFILKMQQENIYIACQHGANDTDIAFILNDFFNPKLEGKEKTTIPPSDSDFPIKLNTIYELDLYGSYEINIYKNKIYGIILEIKEQENPYLDYYNGIDMKITISKYNDFIYKVNNYYKELKNNCEIYTLDGIIYAIPKKDEFQKLGILIENSEIIYGKQCNQIKKRAKKINPNF